MNFVYLTIENMTVLQIRRAAVITQGYVFIEKSEKISLNYPHCPLLSRALHGSAHPSLPTKISYGGKMLNRMSPQQSN